MEIFTTIEFNEEEFSKMKPSLDKLKSEGWEDYHTEQYRNDGVVVAVKYWFKRYI